MEKFKIYYFKTFMTEHKININKNYFQENQDNGRKL